MKTKLIIAAIFLALGITLFALAQTSSPAGQHLANSTNGAQAQSVHVTHLPAGFSADAAYKSNCTRCHAEIPKMETRRTRTIVQHMRVRANLTRDEAEAIFEYLNK